MTKEQIRKQYIDKRDQLSEDQIEDQSLAIANQLLQLPIWDRENYHVFLSIENKKEINTEYILHILSGKDKNTILSKSDFKNGTMEHFLLTDGTTLKINSYGIPEPVNGFKVQEKDLDVIFVPLLAFDTTGHRIGYGKGFYDRFLSACSENTIKIGLSLFPVHQPFKDISETDIPLDYCITPDKIYEFK